MVVIARHRGLAGLLCLQALLLVSSLFVVVDGDCGSGIKGILNNEVCCAEECGSCGGKGCSDRSGGAEKCCTSKIIDSGVSCSDAGEGPCLVGSSASGGCGSGIKGILNNEVCCAEECGSCGGKGCSDRSGGAEKCCTSKIIDSGVSCSDAGEGPCLVGSSASEDSDGKGRTSSSPSPSPSPNPSPTPVMTVPSSCELSTPDFRWNEDTGVGGRLYAEGKGCFTMTDLYNFRGKWNSGESKGPVYVLDDDNNVDYYPDKFTGKWLLTSELYVTGGGTFYCQGTNIGGDCNELRIESRGSKAYHEIRGHGGNLYFENTVVTSWDTPNKKPQETFKNGRSFLNCLSEKVTGTTCAKNDMGECRMDILNSEVGYLGFPDSESYGITWKVRGFCSDLSNPDVFEKVNVYGDIKDSDIHHNYYGHYSYGLQGGLMTNNKMHHNHQYGFDPHDDSDYLTISGNEVYENVNHGIIASKRCNNVKIFDNTVRDGGKEAVGIFLHRSSNDCEVYGNTITNMGDAGISLMESEDAEIHHNTVDGAEFGIRLNLGARDNNVYENTFNDISNVGLFTYFGSDPPEASDGRPYNNKFYDNKITDTQVGVKLKDSDNIQITDNYFSGTKEIEFNDAQKTKWSGNTLPSGTCLINRGDSSSFTSSSGLPDEC